MTRLLLTASLLLIASCSTLEQTADTVAASSLNPANWRISPEAPPKAPPKRPAPPTLDGIVTLPETPGARLWVAEPGQTARTMMEAWSKEAGWTLIWQASVDRKVTVGAGVYGRFEDAVTTVFNAGFPGPPALTPRFYTSNKVLRISQDGTLGE